MSTKIFRAAFGILLLPFFFTACQETMNQEQYGTQASKYVQYWNTGEFEGIEDVMAEDFMYYMSPDYEPAEGIENFKELVLSYHANYDNFTIEVKEYVEGNDTRASIYTATATHKESGASLNVTGMSFLHFRDGKIANAWASANNLAWWQQMGYELTMPTADTAMPVEE